MITNPAVFEEGWLPRSLPGREAEIKTLLRALDRANTEEGQADDLLLSGPSGVGKTTLARYGLETVRRETGAEISSTRVTCLGHNYGAILRKVGKGLDADVHEGTRTADLVDELQASIDKPAVVVLDEGDDLPETEVLRALSDVSGLSMLCICHDPDDWLARVDEPHRERFRGDNHLALSRYSVSELSTILEARYRQGLSQSSPPRRRLEQIADRAAGVARTGIQTLRSAAELAWERGHDEITTEDVEDGLEEARHRIRESNLRSLPVHHHVLYEIVRSADGWIGGRELHNRYERLQERVYQNFTRQPIGRRARRTKLQKLQDYDLVEAEGQGTNRRYRALDSGVQSDVVDEELLVV